MPGKRHAAAFKYFYYMFMSGSSHRGDVNDVIYDYEGAHEGQYGSKGLGCYGFT